MVAKVKNNAVSTIANALTSTATTLTVGSGTGDFFPVLGSGDYFYATLTSTTNGAEIVKVTARTGDTFTVERAQENTLAIPFPANSRIEQRITAQTITDLLTPQGDYLLL